MASIPSRCFCEKTGLRPGNPPQQPGERSLLGNGHLPSCPFCPSLASSGYFCPRHNQHPFLLSPQTDSCPHLLMGPFCHSVPGSNVPSESSFLLYHIEVALRSLSVILPGFTFVTFYIAIYFLTVSLCVDSCSCLPLIESKLCQGRCQWAPPTVSPPCLE